MTAPPDAGVLPGDVLAGKYRVERILGVGGMGVVVAAHHLQLDEKVALKFLLPEALRNREAVARFAREARTAVKIKNEHVARVSDVGELANGAPYMVMEYLEGGDLAGWLEQSGALPIEQAVEFVLQACVAVADAHALGVVHRDLKPANLFCVRRSDGQLSIKVLDFGISKVTEASTGPGSVASMTRTSAVMGTPLYMAPEQMRSAKAVDARSDIWALGVILFELISGRSPFLADTLMELTLRIVQEPPPPLRTFRPEAPAGLEAAILRCLEKEPERRFRHVGELAVALLPFAPRRSKPQVERISGILQAAGLSVSALDVPHSPPLLSGGTHVSSGTLPPVGRTTLGSSNAKPALLGGLAALLLASGAVGTYLYLSQRPPVAHDDFTAAATPPSAPVASASTAVPALVTPVGSTPAPSTSSVPPASAAPSHKVATTPPLPPPRATHQATPPSVPASPPQPPPAAQKRTVDCSQPFTIDAQNHHVPRPECL